MMAPVLVKGATARKVYIPEGQWQHLFTGEQVVSPRNGFYLEIDCPMGTPAAFKRINVPGALDIDFSQ